MEVEEARTAPQVSVAQEPGPSAVQDLEEVNSNGTTSWLQMDRFKFMQPEVEELNQCYSAKSRPSWRNIFIDAKDPLLGSSSREEYYHKRVLYWAPELFYKNIFPLQDGKFAVPCAHCSCYARSRRWNKDGPRIVTTLNDTYYMLVMAVHENQMNHLYKGCLSDHPEVDLYSVEVEGTDERFMQYLCSRGNSPLEGSHFHTANNYCGKVMSAAPIGIGTENIKDESMMN
jgi:hypothetical protein